MSPGIRSMFKFLCPTQRITRRGLPPFAANTAERVLLECSPSRRGICRAGLNRDRLRGAAVRRAVCPMGMTSRQALKVFIPRMQQLQIRRLPVLDREKRLVGIVSLGDLAAKGDPEQAGEALADISEPARRVRSV